MQASPLTTSRLVVLALLSLTAALGGCSARGDHHWSKLAARQRPRAWSKVSSQYLTMDDGVRIAVDLYLPRRRVPDERLPTMLHQTRYWRALDLHRPFKWLINNSAHMPATERLRRGMLEQGFAWVSIDVRGSGASFGDRPRAFTAEEISDGAAVVDWIIDQPWSNGRVGAVGISYDGMAAEMLLVNQHPAVKAAAPLFSMFDLYADLVYPGGVYLEKFARGWEVFIRAFDMNTLARVLPGVRGWVIKGVAPVDEDPQGRSLARAVFGHITNYAPDRLLRDLEVRDRVHHERHMQIDDSSPHAYLERIDQSGAAVYSYSGWYDGALQRAAIHRHLNLTNPENRLIIGPWNHSGWQDATPGIERRTRFDHVGELGRFFEHHLRPAAIEPPPESRIHYYTMGAERWNATDQWPPPAARRVFYLGDNELTTQPVVQGRHSVLRADRMPALGSGTRWDTLVGARPLRHRNLAEIDAQRLCFTSAPLAQTLEITGHPVVTLYVASTGSDAQVFCYLEAIDDAGRVIEITQGVRRAVHRKMESSPAYSTVVPQPSYRSEDMQPLVPGEVVELTFDLLPTSYRIEVGSRLRLALASADRDHFLAPPDPSAVLSIHRGGAWPARLTVPVIVPPQP